MDGAATWSKVVQAVEKKSFPVDLLQLIIEISSWFFYRK